MLSIICIILNTILWIVGNSSYCSQECIDDGIYVHILFHIFVMYFFVINEILIWLAYPKGITDRAKNILNNDEEYEKMTTFFVFNFIVIIIHVIILLCFYNYVVSSIRIWVQYYKLCKKFFFIYILKYARELTKDIIKNIIKNS